jgi:hypothetical protein
VVQHGRPHLHSKTQQPSNRDRTVVRFRRRHAPSGASAERDVIQNHEPNIVFLLSLAKYGSDGEEDDYRHRMIVNGLAFMVTLALIATGVWLVGNLHD